MSGEKTEQPTQKKLNDAREKGQVSQSQDITSTALLITAFAIIGLSWPSTFQRLKAMILLPADYYTLPFEEAFSGLILELFISSLYILVPLLAAVFVVGIGASFFQVGPLFAPESIKPDLEKLNPFEKAQQIFGMKGFIELGKGILKTVFLGVLLFFLIREMIPPLLLVPYSGLSGIIEILSPVLKKLAINVSLAYIVIAAFDWFLQKKQFEKQMMMSKEEVKQEYKEMEGNPEIKSKRKQLAKEIAMDTTMNQTRKSTVLVTNPTHYAVAIDYEKGRTKLPIVLAKGEGFLAHKMIEIAKEEGIPIMQNVPLAQALFAEAAVDNYIPSDMIEPVAEVLRWVQQLKKDQPS